MGRCAGSALYRPNPGKHAVDYHADHTGPTQQYELPGAVDDFKIGNERSALKDLDHEAEIYDLCEVWVDECLFFCGTKQTVTPCRVARSVRHPDPTHKTDVRYKYPESILPPSRARSDTHPL